MTYEDPTLCGFYTRLGKPCPNPADRTAMVEGRRVPCCHAHDPRGKSMQNANNIRRGPAKPFQVGADNDPSWRPDHARVSAPVSVTAPTVIPTDLATALRNLELARNSIAEIEAATKASLNELRKSLNASIFVIAQQVKREREANE